MTLMSCTASAACVARHGTVADCANIKAPLGCIPYAILTNGQHACVLVFMPTVDILNIPCDYQFVFSVLDELCVSRHARCSG